MDKTNRKEITWHLVGNGKKVHAFLKKCDYSFCGIGSKKLIDENQPFFLPYEKCNTCSKSVNKYCID